jgi:23S rRNA (guanine745-N1)-methyltransferase
MTAAYRCPLCTQALRRNSAARCYACAAGHSFDIAKTGYVNLLPVQHKHSSVPGDSAAMLQARRDFLQAGYYQPLAEALAAVIIGLLNTGCLLDVGCGEGYYTRYLHAHCAESGRLELHGVDIAKPAVMAAAKKLPAAHYAVASSQRLPYANDYFDVVLRNFAPAAESELYRIVKPQGYLIIITPAPLHLTELKAFIYHEVQAHAATIELPQGFSLLSQQRLTTTFNPSLTHRAALLQMTPFAWRATPARCAALQQAEHLTITADFLITLACKNENP